MRVLGIWRYPVKSVGGERLDETSIGEHGIPGDRGWGLVDDPTGLVLTARREPRLLMAEARMVDDEPLATTVDGHELRTSADFSEWPGLERDIDVLRTVNATRDGCLAVGATVTAPGRVAVGDLLTPS